MDAWRTLQREIMDHLLAGRLTGVKHEPVVKSGDVRRELSRLVNTHGIDLVVLGTRGRSGMWRLLLGSVAESVIQQVPCPVLTVGPNVPGEYPGAWPERILVPTGFAAQSFYAITYASWLERRLRSSMAILHVVADETGVRDQEEVQSERLQKLQRTVAAAHDGALRPELLVEFGSVSEKVLQTAARWKADLIILGVHHAEEATISETNLGKASEIVRRANCPVLTVRLPTN